eukprot:CAMPEP_0183312290 /NCGR_PEP_ID=MMETSP0160_2-20130417/41128_1 /TAXON_ID=2839 ORGANISM="Odontella Sinensis, Strain Grunow 1884" /NCGR_SAMPLE_ID=MMETSP0160_2 /ASSEMBLY_ACC=CAM_ASM_000250 /LENGTH=53 /DNA_ID=CAMNT_0025477119 /DNA_START=13 /DNA_END=174 /DNA_ORIENTATION=+
MRRSSNSKDGGGDLKGRERRRDTPEEIEAKRAARRAKREALEQDSPADGREPT